VVADAGGNQAARQQLGVAVLETAQSWKLQVLAWCPKPAVLRLGVKVAILDSR